MTTRHFDHAAAERAKIVTREFRFLQGYRALPWVPAVLLWWGSESGALQGAWWLWAFTAAVVVGALGSWALGRWYDRNYGSIRRRSDATLRLVATLGLVVAVIVVSFVGLSLAGVGPWHLEDAPVAWIAAGLGAAWAATGWRLRPLTAQTWWFGIALAVVALLPLGLLEVFGGRHPLNRDGALFGVFALFLIVVGTGAHRALDRAMRAPGDAPTDAPSGTPGATEDPDADAGTDRP